MRAQSFTHDRNRPLPLLARSSVRRGGATWAFPEARLAPSVPWIAGGIRAFASRTSSTTAPGEAGARVRRLRELEAEGLVERCVHDGTPARVSYALTEKGRGLRPAIRELRAWAQRWNGSDA